MKSVEQRISILKKRNSVYYEEFRKGCFRFKKKWFNRKKLSDISNPQEEFLKEANIFKKLWLSEIEKFDEYHYKVMRGEWVGLPSDDLEDSFLWIMQKMFFHNTNEESNTKENSV